jgi:hypothetical protein
VLYGSLTALPSLVNAERIGLRRAALIMLEEGMLLAIRRPKAAVAILDRAARLFTRLEDFMGAMLSDLSLGLLAIKLNKPRVLQTALHYLKEKYAKLRESEKTLPEWNELTACIDSVMRGEKEDILFGFLNNQSKNLCWRPTLVRLLYCIARVQTSGDIDANAAALHLKNWIRDNYGRTEGNQFIFPSDFDFSQAVSAAESGLSEVELIVSSSEVSDLNLPITSAIDVSLRRQKNITDNLPVTAQTSASTFAEYITPYRIQS